MDDRQKKRVFQWVKSLSNDRFWAWMNWVHSRAYAAAVQHYTEAGITIFEDEFMAHIVLPDGRTVGEYMLAPIEDSYRTGQMPALLPQLTSGKGIEKV